MRGPNATLHAFLPTRQGEVFYIGAYFLTQKGVLMSHNSSTNDHQGYIFTHSQVYGCKVVDIRCVSLSTNTTRAARALVAELKHQSYAFAFLRLELGRDIPGHEHVYHDKEPTGHPGPRHVVDYLSSVVSKPRMPRAVTLRGSSRSALMHDTIVTDIHRHSSSR